MSTAQPGSGAQRATVSVVIPAYNVAPFIAETLTSVFNQSYPAMEVIVINDGSPDSAQLEIALAPYRERLTYVAQENRGAAVARNRGVEIATGQFIAFLDGDDVWLPDFLQSQLSHMDGEGADMIYADAELFGESPLAGRTFMALAPSSGPVTSTSLINGQCNVITSGVLVRRQLVVDVGMMDATLRNAQDFDLWFRLVQHGAQVTYQRKVLLRHRIHHNSLSGDSMNRVNRELRVYGKIENLPDLTPAERTAVTERLVRLRADYELESGKLQLLKGNMVEARAAFARSQRLRRTWKLSAVGVLARFAPGLLQRLYVQRART